MPQSVAQQVRELLEREIKLTDELSWRIKAEETLSEVMEGLAMRIQELEDEDDEL